VIAAKIRRAKKASFYHVPCNWVESGQLRWVSNKDPKLLKIERRVSASRQRKKAAKSVPSRPSDGPLFEYKADDKEKK
jgi:hypothetical protein